jgi:hypothetical protein
VKTIFQANSNYERSHIRSHLSPGNRAQKLRLLANTQQIQKSL